MSGVGKEDSQQGFELPIYKSQECDSTEQVPADP